jgi:hypothetical protein
MWHHLLQGADYYLKSWLSLSLPKNILISLWNPKVHHHVHKSRPLDPLLSQPNTVRPVDPYLPKFHLNIILLPTPGSSRLSLPFEPPNQNPVNTSPLPNACQRISAVTRRFENFRNNIIHFSRWGVVSPTPNLKLEDHSLSAVRDCLFNIFAATLHIWRPSPPSTISGRAMPWWQGTHLTWGLCITVTDYTY